MNDDLDINSIASWLKQQGLPKQYYDPVIVYLKQKEFPGKLKEFNKSEVNFVKRLLDPNRKTIKGKDGKHRTHKMSWAILGPDEAILYPEVLEINGELVDLSDSGKNALKSALDLKDYVITTPEFADWFSLNYKDYYPGFDKYQSGGNISNDTEITDVKISGKIYHLEVADTEEKQKVGLMGRDDIPDDGGMLFDFETIGEHEMWMKDTKIPLTQIFLDSSLVVLKVADRQPFDKQLIGCPNTAFVIEIKPGLDVKQGDAAEFVDEDEADYTMQILAPDGSSQMDLQGGERIVSRKETKVLIHKAKLAYKSKQDKDYKSLGRYIFNVFDKQDNRKPEYVSAPN